MDEEQIIGLTVRNGVIHVVNVVKEKKIMISTKDILTRCSKRISNHLAKENASLRTHQDIEPDFILMNGYAVFYFSDKESKIILLEQELYKKNIEKRTRDLEDQKYIAKTTLRYASISEKYEEELKKRLSIIQKKIDKVVKEEKKKFCKRLLSHSKQLHEKYARISFDKIVEYKGPYYTEKRKCLETYGIDSIGGYIELDEYMQLLKEFGYEDGEKHDSLSIANPIEFIAYNVENSGYSEFSFADLRTKRAQYGKIKALKSKETSK